MHNFFKLHIKFLITLRFQNDPESNHMYNMTDNDMKVYNTITSQKRMNIYTPLRLGKWEHFGTLSKDAVG